MSGSVHALNVVFDLGSGSTVRGPAGVWAATNYVGVTGSVNVVGTNGATFQVTGVKLEIGSVATPFNRQSLAKSMADCQRYFQKIGGAAGSDFILQGYSATAGVGIATTIGIAPMRCEPAVTIIGSFGEPGST